MRVSGRKIGKDNRGVSLITVIITVTFMAVLGTILVSAALVNYQMKQLDKRSKKNFYTAEAALDDVYNGLGKNITILIADSYDRALEMNNTGDRSAGAAETGFETEEEAFAYLKKEFVKQFQTYYALGAPGDPLNATNPINSAENKEKMRDILQSYLVTPCKYDATGKLIAAGAVVEEVGDIVVEPDNNYISLKKVVVSSNTLGPDGEPDLLSSVTTDIVLWVPTLRMFDDHDYLWDYAIVGNKGVYVTDTGSGTGASSVAGNLFAGVGDGAADTDVYGQKKVAGGLNILNSTMNLHGETIVSAGDVNIKNGTLDIGGLGADRQADLWAGNINLAKGPDANQFSMYGNTFLNNDLEINSDNSKVVLGGNFYGYNNNFVTEESLKQDREHARSSSILVNGRKNILDVKDLDLLLIAGRAYMDMDTRDIQVETATENEKEYSTGEALSLRTNQMIYLVPTEFLPYANPEQNRPDMVEITKLDESEMRKEDWFGTQYLNEEQPVKQKIVKGRKGTFVYYFLNFKDDISRNQYVNDILNASETDKSMFAVQARELRHKMEERAGTVLDENILINQGSEICSVYSNSEVMDYTKGDGTRPGEIRKASSGANNLIRTNVYAEALNSRYAYIRDTLDPKKDVPLDKVIGAYGGRNADLPLSKFVTTDPADGYMDLMSKYVSAADGFYRRSVTGTPYEVIISKDDVVLDSQNFSGVILTLGNVTLSNCTVNGLVLSNGEVKLENSEVNADREIVMTIIEEESQEIDAMEYTKTSDDHKRYFVHYLKDPRYNGEFVYGKDAIGTDYTEFITYENWKKGDVR